MTAIVDPSVIDLELLDNSIVKIINEKTTSRLTKLQVVGITGAVTSETIKTTYRPDPPHVKNLRLDFQNILKIDNLLPYKNLTKLQLDNNLIEKIENLDHLVNLESLDLSFNRLKKIEGLSKLKKLVDLTLFQNSISVIEGLDTLENLRILSMGNNQVSKIDNIKYLIRFKLFSLNLAGNPICRDPEYGRIIISCLKTLKFLDYQPLSETQVKDARERHEELVLEINKAEKVLEEEKKKQEEIEIDKELIKNLHLEKLYKLFDIWTLECEDMKSILCIAPKELATHFDKVRPKVIEVVSDLKQYLATQIEKRESTLKEHLEQLDKFKKSIDEKSYEKLKLYKRKVKQEKPSKEGGDNKKWNATTEHEKKLQELLEQLYHELMAAEMASFENLDDSLLEFESKYRGLLKEVCDGIKVQFQRLRTIAGELHQAVCEITDKNYEQLLQLNIDDVEKDAQELLANQDLFSNLQNGINEKFALIVDTMEEQMLAVFTKEVDDVISNFFLDEWQRNRDRVREFHKFFELNKVD